MDFVHVTRILSAGLIARCIKVVFSAKQSISIQKDH